MRNILFISYNFPPIQSPESLRSLRSMKFLVRMDCKPVVLTSQRDIVGKCDVSLLSKLPRNLSVYKASSLQVLNLFPWWILSKVWLWGFSTHYLFGWLPFAIRKAKQIIKREKIGVIISKSTPIASHLVALNLKSSHGLPWIADFSDPWVAGNPFLKYRSECFRRIDESLESQVAHSADRIIFTTEGIKAQFLNKYKNIQENKVSVIPNSYDPEDFMEPHQITKSDNFLIVHTGNFYHARSPEPFLKALKLLRDNENISNVRVKFIGRIGEFRNLITKYGLSDIVEAVGPVSHKDVVSYLYSANVLLLVDAPFSNEASVFLPSKLVEYICVEKPILAITPEKSASAYVVKSTRTGVVVSPNDVNSIKKQIENFYSMYTSSNLQIKPDWTEIEKYSAERCTKALVKIIDEIMH
jgi:glycosyltransferase involved in cell wall biosynthesis